jgi:drug/metabolite transporter (DMT)-like permease
MYDLTRARCQIVCAGVLWSLSGLFAKALTKPTALRLHEPPISFLAIAEYRALFAGLAMVPMLRAVARPPFDGKLAGMMACFSVMSVLFVAALTGGTAAAAILLQYTAPLWLLLVGVVWLKEPVERRDVWMLVGGLTGVGVLVAGDWSESNPVTIAAALGSGFFYAGVVLFLRVQRDRPAPWLTIANVFGNAAVLSPVLLIHPMPSVSQLLWLAAFGIVQLAVPYWLMARGLRHVPSFEAGLLTLVEPVLNPVWAYLISPESEKPTIARILGGLMILGTLAARYWPVNPRH